MLISCRENTVLLLLPGLRAGLRLVQLDRTKNNANEAPRFL